MLQRRQFSRFEVRAPVMFCWKAQGQLRVVKAYTDDISAGGMYIATGRCPPGNATVRCQLLLPSVAVNVDPGSWMVANTVGKVTRIERGEFRCGFAVRHRTFVLRDEHLDREQWEQSILHLWRTA